MKHARVRFTDKTLCSLETAYTSSWAAAAALSSEAVVAYKGRLTTANQGRGENLTMVKALRGENQSQE